jgi:HK97 family phage prohead protease
MPSFGGAKRLNSEQAKLSFLSSPLCGKRLDLPLRVEIDEQETKAAREKEPEKRKTILRGYASTTSLDAHKHIIPSSAWKTSRALGRFRKNPVVLYQHNPEYVVGVADEAEPDKDGLYVKLSISGAAKIATGEPLGDLLADGRLRTLSVGIRILDYEIQELDGEVFATLTEVELLEISIVSIPANEDATFEVSKSIVDYVTKSLGNEPENGGNMDRKMICKALGLKEDASDLEIMQAMNGILSLSAEGKAFRKSLGLAEDAPFAEVQKALTDRDPAKFAALVENDEKRKAADLVAKYASKVNPAMREWAESYARKDAAGFETWAKAAPDAVTAGAGTAITAPSTATPGTPAPTSSKSKSVTPEDEEICSKFGTFENADEMEKLAATTPADALSWIFGGRKFALTNHDKDTMRRREQLERISA